MRFCTRRTTSALVSINGQVSGTTISAGENIEVMDAVLEKDFWSAGEFIQINHESEIFGNALVAAELASISGKIGRDLTAAAETVELRGRVGEDMVTYAAHLKLLGESTIAGDLTIHTDDEEGLSQSPNSIVGVVVMFEHKDMEGRSRNRYATVKYYVLQLLRLAAALVVGYGLLTLFPMTGSVTLNSGVAGLATAGIGLVALVSLPIISLLLGLTVIGLPLTMFGFFVWLLCLYLAKIMVAWLIGGMLFDDPDRERGVFLPLLTGLAIVLFGINIPFIGGFINVMFTIVGLGMISQWLWANYSSDRASV